MVGTIVQYIVGTVRYIFIFFLPQACTTTSHIPYKGGLETKKENGTIRKVPLSRSEDKSSLSS